jgi:hypothetical protein
MASPPLTFLLLGISRTFFKLAVRNWIERLIVNLVEGLLFAGLVYFWQQIEAPGVQLNLLTAAILYLAGDVLVTLLLFVAGLIRLRRAGTSMSPEHPASAVDRRHA